MLAKQFRLSHVGIGIPLANEKFSQERVERFFLTAQLLTAAAILLAKGAEEPFENRQSPLFRIRFLSRGDEQRWVLGPIGRIFGQRSGRENEGWGSQRGEVSAEGCDRLWKMKSQAGISHDCSKRIVVVINRDPGARVDIGAIRH